MLTSVRGSLHAIDRQRRDPPAQASLHGPKGPPKGNENTAIPLWRGHLCLPSRHSCRDASPVYFLRSGLTKCRGSFHIPVSATANVSVNVSGLSNATDTCTLIGRKP